MDHLIRQHHRILKLGGFGVAGYLMRKFEFDAPPLILAFVLGPIFERTFRQSLIMSRGSLFIFLQRPISAVLMSISIFLLLFPSLRYFLRGRSVPFRSQVK
jgi:putative tricarboxylic transport membrane protein